MTVETFRQRVDAAMQDTYGITWHDACGDTEPLEQALANGETPEEFVRWWGEKYDLTPRSEW